MIAGYDADSERRKSFRDNSVAIQSYLQVQTPNWNQGQSASLQHELHVVPLPQTVPAPQQGSDPQAVKTLPAQ